MCPLTPVAYHVLKCPTTSSYSSSETPIADAVGQRRAHEVDVLPGPSFPVLAPEVYRQLAAVQLVLDEGIGEDLAFSTEQHRVSRINQLPFLPVSEGFAWRYAPYAGAVAPVDGGELCDVWCRDEFRTTMQRYCF
jgi:hypothetical protein